jgi:hypothetical protein
MRTQHLSRCVFLPAALAALLVGCHTFDDKSPWDGGGQPGAGLDGPPGQGIDLASARLDATIDSHALDTVPFDGGGVRADQVVDALAWETEPAVEQDAGATPDGRGLTDSFIQPDVGGLLPSDGNVFLADVKADTTFATDAAIGSASDAVVLLADAAVLPPDGPVIPSDRPVFSEDVPVPVEAAGPDAPDPVADAPVFADHPACTPALSLTARGENGSATLQWTGASASTFQIWRGASAAGPYTTIATTGANSFTDSSSLPNGASVFYQVSTGTTAPACDSVSNVAEAIPCAPPTVTATTFGNDVTLRWAATGASQYAIAYGPSQDALSTTVTTSALSYVIANLPKNQPLYAKVSSNNATCSAGDSQVLSATPTGCTSWPAKPVLTGTPDSNQVVLTWPDPTGGTGALTYTLGFAATQGGPVSTLSSTATSGYAHQDLTNGQSYAYVLTATDSLGCVSATSDEVLVTPTRAACKALACEDFSTSSSDSWTSGDWFKSDQTICYNGTSAAAFGQHTINDVSVGAAQTIQAKINFVTCNQVVDYAGAGVQVRAGSSNHYTLTLDCDGVLRLRRDYTILTGCEYNLPAPPADGWRLLKLSAAGTTLSGYLDDMATPKFTCTDSHLESGVPGLAWRLGSSRFCADNIRVTSP